MPGVGSGPSLAESWSMSKDMLVADFTLRANAKFHNGEPVTADDVKFSFERYRGGAAKVLKDAVKELQTPAPNRVRFVFKEPWPDFSAFYGTFVASAGWVVPKNYVERVGEEGFARRPSGGAVQVREPEPRRGAGGGSLRGLLAQAALDQAHRLPESSR